jgi:tetratricopeptide (TPR) repeat protein
MNWLLTEYLLKGIFLGLLTYAALQRPDWAETGALAGFLSGGLAVGLLLSFLSWLPRGIRVGGRFLSLLLFLLLESPTLIYAGLIGGLLAGALYVRDPATGIGLLVMCLGGGALLGAAIGEARRIGSTTYRSAAAAAGACLLVGVALYMIEHDPELTTYGGDAGVRALIGGHLLLGLPFFYLLTFAGRAEESEGEFAALCAALAVGIWLLNPFPRMPALALVLSAGIYVTYTHYVMAGLKVFKHTLRGYSYAQMGKIRPALRSFRRALTLDPNNQTARAGLARVHSHIDPQQIAGDTETASLLDLDLCLDRAGRLLFQPEPTQAQLDEVHSLLELVAWQQNDRLAEVEYWRAIADMRKRDPVSAATRLAKLLDAAAWSIEQSFARQNVLFPAWQMVLMRSQELGSRVGHPQLALSGRRMEAIAATERLLAVNSHDSDAAEMKRFLYEGLTEKEYHERRPVTTGEFDPNYARELGIGLLNDSTKWHRGVEYLRLAADSWPQHAPSIFLQIAQACEHNGEPEEARKAYEAMKEVVLAFGPKNLPTDEATTFFMTIKRLADEAATRDDPRGAISLLRIIVEGDRAGVQTFRALAEMHERHGEALPALHYNDLALVYASTDRDLLARKDKYYYSVTPEQLKSAAEVIRKGFDVDYCLSKARQVLATRNAELDTIDWGLHLAELASVLMPNLIEPRLLRARALLWKGEKERALQVLEDVREAKPAKFAGDADEDAWYRTHQMLGDMYLNDFARPDLAVPCYTEFRDSPKSGADTLFKLGQAYEALGDIPRAVRSYEQVTGYTEHPRYYEATEAVRRLKQGTSG